MKKSVLLLLDELIKRQKQHLLKTARQIVPHVTDEDLLQPNDFPKLENHPYFRYEEGLLHGFQAVKAALLTKSTRVSASSKAELSLRNEAAFS